MRDQSDDQRRVVLDRDWARLRVAASYDWTNRGRSCVVLPDNDVTCLDEEAIRVVADASGIVTPRRTGEPDFIATSSAVPNRQPVILHVLPVGGLSLAPGRILSGRSRAGAEAVRRRTPERMG